MKTLLIKKPSAPALLLTPLLDMFTIILIFLIVSFEAEDYDFRLSKNVELPESSARSVFKPAVSVAVSASEILLQDRRVAPLSKGMAAPEHYETGEIPALVEALDDVYRAKYGDEEEAEDTDYYEGSGAEEGEDEAIILVQADKAISYKTLYLVLRSAAQAGFLKYRLVVSKK